MDALSSIFTWLSDHEAGISAVVGIAVLAGIVLAGLRSLVRRRGETTQEKAPSAAIAELAPAAASDPDLDPLTVPGFEGRPAIAVLPFDNLSGDPEQEYFADGIAEDLITRLSAWRDFPVIARNSSLHLQGQARRREAGEPGAGRALRRGGQRAAVGGAGSNRSPSHRRHVGRITSGPRATTGNSGTSLRCKTRSRKPS